MLKKAEIWKRAGDLMISKSQHGIGGGGEGGAGGVKLFGISKGEESMEASCP